MKLTIHRDYVAIIVPRQFKEALAILYEKADKKHNGFVSIDIDLPKRPRSTGEKSQSHHLNGNIQQICQETGNPFDVVKAEIKFRSLARGYPILYKDGKPILDLWGREMGISEADSSVEQCAILIDESIRLAKEQGIERLKGEEE